MNGEQTLITETSEFALESLTEEGLKLLTEQINDALIKLKPARLTRLSLQNVVCAADGTVRYWRLHFQT